MKDELLFFMLPNCPYCRRAAQYLEELQQERPEFQSIPVREIDERVQAELANQYDYYFVPSFYLGRRKLHEGAMGKSDVLRVLTIAKGAESTDA